MTAASAGATPPPGSAQPARAGGAASRRDPERWRKSCANFQAPMNTDKWRSGPSKYLPESG